MPTVHVNVGSTAHLQDIADAISTAKRIVVVTGAGISTNAGIPDFRSTGGLYSLIQAQYDATFKSSGARNEDDVATADPFDSWDAIDPRPTKRRRLFADDSTVETETREGGIQQGDTRTNGSNEAALDDRDTLPSLAGYKLEKSDSTEHPPWVSSAVPTPCLVDNEMTTGLSGGDQVEKATCTKDAASHGSLRTRLDRPDANPTKLSSEEHCLPSSQTSCSRLSSDSPLSSPPFGLLETHGRFSPHESTSPSLADSRPCSSSDSEDPSPDSTPSFPGQSCNSLGRHSLSSLKGKDMFDTQVWASSSKTEVFYKFQTALRKISKTAEPTDTHRFLVALRDQKKLVRCYSQNIDLLEEKVGLSTALELGPGSRIRFTTRKAPGCARDLGGEEVAASDSEQSSQQSERANGEVVKEEKATGTPAAEPSLKTETSEKDDRPPTAPTSQAMSAADAATIRTGHAPQVRGVECVLLHGSLSELRCFQCGKTASWDEEGRELATLAGGQPLCPHCIGATNARRQRGKRATGVGMLRPDIVLYGEENPRDHLIQPLLQEDLSAKPDMLLIMGTSLRVHGLKFIVKDFARMVHKRGGYVVFVNKTKPADSVWRDVIDYWVSFDCDAWVADLRQQKPVLWEPLTTAKPARRRPKAKRTEAASSGAPAPAAESKDCIEANSTPQVVPGSPAAAEGPKRSRRASARPQARGKTAHDTGPRGQGARDHRRGDVRERKLNPNAKRPQAGRDHKTNGAYLTWKMLRDLARISANLDSGPDAGAAPPVIEPPCPRPGEPATAHRRALPGYAPQTMPISQQNPEMVAHSEPAPGHNFTAATDGPHMAPPPRADLFPLSSLVDNPFTLANALGGCGLRPPELDARNALLSLSHGVPSLASQASREWSSHDQLQLQLEAQEAAKALTALRGSH